MKKSANEGTWPALDSSADDMDSTFFVSREMWIELTKSYRETLNTASNLCWDIESVVKRVELGRVDGGDALERIRELCVVTNCGDFLDDRRFLDEVLGVTFRAVRDLSSPDDESQDSSPDDGTPRRRVH